MAKNTENILPLQFIKGIGPKRAEAFAKDGITAPKDLLLYFPVNYIDRSGIISVRQLYKKLSEPQNIDFNIDISAGFNFSNEYTIIATITDKQERKFARGRGMLSLSVQDAQKSTAKITFWNGIQFFSRKFETGMLLLISGKAEIDNYNFVAFNHPEIDIISPEDEQQYNSGSVLPKYKITENLSRAGITGRTLRSILEKILPENLHLAKETLSPDILADLNLPNAQDMIKNLHFPESRDALLRARHRLKFEEIFYYMIPIVRSKMNFISSKKGIIIDPKSEKARKLYENLPFDLTSDQKKVLREIAKDLESGNAMNRLLQGDVGSGKTIVALLCLLMAIDCGYQTAFMAPTEILAEQHYHSLCKYLDEFGIKTVQLVGGQKKRMRELVKHSISSGEANVIVGTHAMFQSDLEYNKLALVIIDEQHRFGVAQRGELIELAKKSFPEENEIIPHILVMTATPIPRTLTMTAYGDLDVSVIKTKPKNRKPIQTKVAFESNRDIVYQFIRDRVREGEQAYIVFPLVEDSEKLELKSAVAHYELLSQNVFSDLNCGLIHGQMLWYEKEEAMKSFLDKEYEILISTTVIEVGIDVPNATVIVIENAERFGLSQLHQLRGRVGRGEKQSYCVLMSPDHFKFQLKRVKDPEKEKTTAIARLKIMELTGDGFQISEFDMKLRGPGDVLGTKQSGLPDFKYIDLAADVEIVAQAKKTAQILLQSDPELLMPQHQIIKKNLDKHYIGKNYFEIA